MKLFDDWIRMRVFDPQKDSGLALPQGYERSMSEDDLFFQVIEMGPACKKVKIGNVVSVSIMSANMYRMKVPAEPEKTFAIREGEIIGVLYNQPPKEVPNAVTGTRSIIQET